MLSPTWVLMGFFGSLSFDVALQEAAQSAVARAREWRARAAESSASARWREAYLPRIGAEGGFSRRDRELTLETPVGDFELGERSRWNVSARLTQPIFDLEKMAYLSSAAEERAESARFDAAWAREDAIRNAAECYLDLAALEAQARANDGFIAALESRRARVESMVQEGRGVRVDALRIALALDDALQRRLAFKEQRGVLLARLARAVGRRRVDSIEANSVHAFAVRSEAESTARAAARRADVQALKRLVDAQRSNANATWASYLPRIEARGEMIYDDAAIYAENSFLQASVNVVWVPFAGGTRPAAANAAQAEQQATLAQIEDAELGVALRVRDAFARLRIALGEKEVAQRGVEQAAETVRVERVRYEEGRIVVSDLLEAERLFHDRTARLEVAALDWIRSQILVRAAEGSLADAVRVD